MFIRLSRLNHLFTPLAEATRSGVDLTQSLAEAGAGKLRSVVTLINQLLGQFHSTIVKIAATSVALSEVAPHLSGVAGELEKRARQQRENAESIASASRDMADTVAAIASSSAEAGAFTEQVRQATRDAEEASQRAETQIRQIGQGAGTLAQQLAVLQTSCATIGETVQLIKAIADRTRILSLNAAIEAARAGEQGRGFAVVADEVRTLADQTSEATQHVEQVLVAIRQQTQDTATAMTHVEDEVHDGMDASATANARLRAAASDIDTLIGHVRAIAEASAAQSERVGDVAGRIDTVARSTQDQLDDAHRLSACAAQIRTQTEELLTEVGEFRFEGHRVTRLQVEQAAAQWQLSDLRRDQIEAHLAALCRALPALELAYVTDPQGRQMCANVARDSVDAAAVGHDWSTREWYRQPIRSGRVYVSGIYRSAATDDFCFTISLPLRDAAGQPIGVLGADVRFDHIVRA
ncbi:MAG: methyl-accepting chemotaxis protein [Rhodocyclaceae bacterium]